MFVTLVTVPRMYLQATAAPSVRALTYGIVCKRFLRGMRASLRFSGSSEFAIVDRRNSPNGLAVYRPTTLCGSFVTFDGNGPDIAIDAMALVSSSHDEFTEPANGSEMFLR